MDSQDDSFKIGPARLFSIAVFLPILRRGRLPEPEIDTRWDVKVDKSWEWSEFLEESCRTRGRELLLSIASAGIRMLLLIEVLVVMLLD